MADNAIERKVGGTRKLEMRDEAAYGLDAIAPSFPYAREHRFQPECRPSSCHGLICSSGPELPASVLLCSAGGTSGVHERSLCVLEDRCFVAVGPYIVSLSLPGLEVLWATEVDSATCFGIHPTVDGQALISHGELEVARVALSGEILWAAGGADILSEGLSITETEVRVEDFNHDRYVFDVETGSVISSTA